MWVRDRWNPRDFVTELFAHHRQWLATLKFNAETIFVEFCGDSDAIGRSVSMSDISSSLIGNRLRRCHLQCSYERWLWERGIRFSMGGDGCGSWTHLCWPHLYHHLLYQRPSLHWIFEWRVDDDGGRKVWWSSGDGSVDLEPTWTVDTGRNRWIFSRPLLDPNLVLILPMAMASERVWRTYPLPRHNWESDEIGC